MKYVYTISIGLLFILFLTAMTVTQSQQSGVLDSVESAIAEGQAVMFSLNTALPTGEQTITSTEMQVHMDSDFMCFGETWNSGTRQHCVPYSNIASITFITD